MNISEARICFVYHAIYAWLHPFPFLKSMTSPQASKKNTPSQPTKQFSESSAFMCFPYPKVG